MIFFSPKKGQDMEIRAAHPHQEPAGMKTLRSSLNSVRRERSEVQWNPASRPPRYYSHFFWPSGKMAIHFLAKKKKEPSLMRSPVNTAKCFWPIGHSINGVPLYIISTRDTCCCYIVVLIPVLNILGAVQL